MQLLVEEPAALATRYAAFAVPPLGYGTVRDFCDSMDRMPALASHQGDLKDAQRPWMVKAILGTVPRGGRLVEIGAGHPFVASILARLGYQVTVVDPYDGSGNGPCEFEQFSAACPEVRFLRAAFAADTAGLEPGSCDAIYSISVLEHVPLDGLAAVCAGIRRFLAPHGRTIHAIDHVLAGMHDRYHAEHLAALVAGLGGSQTELANALQAARDDVETYFLSAEGHNRWRGSRPYDKFPMRRVISVQLNLPRAAA